MAFSVSPSVIVREVDASQAVPAIATPPAAMAGVFRWGPVNEPILITSENELVDRFGKPTDDNYETFFTAADYLAYSNALYVVRGDTGTKADSTNVVLDANNNVDMAASFYGAFEAKYKGALGNSLEVAWVTSGSFSNDFVTVGDIPQDSLWELVDGDANTNPSTQEIAFNGNEVSFQVANTGQLGALTAGDILVIGNDSVGYQELEVTSFAESANTNLGANTDPLATDDDYVQFYEYTIGFNKKYTLAETSLNNLKMTKKWQHNSLFTGAPGASNLHIAVIDAGGKGNGILITASNVIIDGIRIVNWGDDLTEQNAGIYTQGKLSQIEIRNVSLEGDGFGMWLQNIQHSKIVGNIVVGNIALRSADRGNAIQLTNVKNNYVANNEVSKVRDGLYVINSQDNILENNVMHDLRYGIHYMYSYDNKIVNNKAYNTRAGYAMMNSRNLEIIGNQTRDSEDYGFLLNYIIKSNISNNVIQDVWTKPENKVLGRDGKGFFVYNSGYNTIANNIVERTEIGIHLTAGSEQTQVYGNSFIDNPVQVKYVSNKKQEWSKDGSGNYWSNYLGWDMDNDLKGDVPFEPNDGIDQLLWQYPEMKILMSSPAIIVLRWVQRQFPVLKPPGVKDSYPLMHKSTMHKEVLEAASLQTQNDINTNPIFAVVNK